MISNAVLAVLLCLVSTFFSALGNVTLKWVHVQISLKKFNYSCYKAWQWWGGLFLICIGAITTVFTLGLADQASISPTSCFTMIYNCFLAVWLLHEVFTRYDFIAIVLMCIGAVMSVSSADLTQKSYGMDELEGYFSSVSSIVFCGICLVGFVSLSIISDNIFHQPVVAHSFTPKEKLVRVIPLLTFSGLAGFCSGFTALFSKCLVEVVKTAVITSPHESAIETAADRAFYTHWLFYVFVGALVVSIYVQLTSLNVALAHFDALEVVPVYQSLIVIAGELCGGIVLDEFSSLSNRSFYMFISGSLIVVLGMLVLCLKSPSVGQMQLLVETTELRESPRQSLVEQNDLKTKLIRGNSEVEMSTVPNSV